MFRNKIKYGLAWSVIAVAGIAVQANALPNVGQVKKKMLLKTAAGCDPATATIELDINNVRARIMTGGDMWWNQGTNTAAYEVPKGTRKNALFAGSVWVGGFTADKQLKVCAQTYRQTGNDYWPGPLFETAGTYAIDQATCSDWDRFWKVDRATINRFRELVRTGGNTASSEFLSIWEWPARGNGISSNQNNNTFSRSKGTSGLPLNMEDREYAPFVNNPNDPGNNPDLYEPERGDFPGDPTIGDLLGDQYIWWVFNDRGNIKTETQTESIGMEVQTGAFAFASKDFMNDASFYNYKLINHGTSDLDSTYMATWTDADLGWGWDDYIGCDTVRGLGILYNGNPIDGAGEANSYGSNIPMVGVDFFRGPHRYYIDANGDWQDSVLQMTAFTYFNNSTDTRIGNPSNGVQIYNYMTGTSRNGQSFNNDYQGAGIKTNALGPGPNTRFVFFGDPDKDEWSECNCTNDPGDRRFIHSAGPFTLYPGNVNDITIGAVWVSGTGGCPNTSFAKIRLADDQAQALFDNNFKKIQGPEAPDMVKRELDKRIIFYLSNPVYSTNYMEKYGYELDSSKYRVTSLKAKNLHHPDSLYKFEGYRVFQLKSEEITPAQIFGEDGKVNTEVAVEVFRTDLKNGIKQAVNWSKNIDIIGCDSCFTPILKAEGEDKGIEHSFEITQDAFSTSVNKNLVNYRNYYFVAIAYAYNNFADFDPSSPESTQDVVYLESDQGAGGSPLKVIAAMPNPFSNSVGTEINAKYGDGVVIKKLEGVGNGGNALQLSQESEQEALSATHNYQAIQPTYELGKAPVDIKVIDPMKVEPGTWSLYIRPDLSQSAPYTLPVSADDSVARLIGSKTQWVLVKDGTTAILSERNLDALNEQIVAQYGLSIKIGQHVRPGEDQDETDNGLILLDHNNMDPNRVIYADTSYGWLAGVNDREAHDPQNWIRSGGNYEPANPAEGILCNYGDAGVTAAGVTGYDQNQKYEALFSSSSSILAGTWAPYSLGATDDGLACFSAIARLTTTRPLYDLQSVDIVFTSDTSKWSRAMVLETGIDKDLAEGNALRLKLRKHASWDRQVDANGNPIYSTTDSGFSYFPGYAINQETGERLNIAFGEDSYLRNHNGRDMIWNPTSTIIDEMGSAIFGGRHFVYISKTKYDGCKALGEMLRNTTPAATIFWNNAFKTFIWAGMPTVNVGFNLLPLKDGLIPTETRLKLRVVRPYGRYIATGVDTTLAGSNKGFPWYTFTTDDLAPKKLTDAGNPYANDKQALLDKIHVVPNPYYAYTGYEANRLDSRVRIISLPKRATVRIYSLDGTLIRQLDKDSDVPYIDWDIRNAKSLPIAGGMYLIHVNAEGIGEKIIRWFGAMRPIDVTQY